MNQEDNERAADPRDLKFYVSPALAEKIMENDIPYQGELVINKPLSTFIPKIWAETIERNLFNRLALPLYDWLADQPEWKQNHITRKSRNKCHYLKYTRWIDKQKRRQH